MIGLKLPLAVPLTLLFIISFTITDAYNVMNVLIVDLYYSTPATAMAANNLVRCLLGAGATGAVHPMINALGRGWTYSYIAIAVFSASPLLMLVFVYGLKWRMQRQSARR